MTTPAMRCSDSVTYENMRNEILNQTDKYLLIDYPITEDQKQK